MDILNFFIYYFIFVISIVVILKSTIKKDPHRNVVDYKIDLFLHELKKELNKKIYENFTQEDYKIKENKIIYDILENPFPSKEVPQFISVKPNAPANYVHPYEKYEEYMKLYML